MNEADGKREAARLLRQRLEMGGADLFLDPAAFHKVVAACKQEQDVLHAVIFREVAAYKVQEAVRPFSVGHSFLPGVDEDVVTRFPEIILAAGSLLGRDPEGGPVSFSE